MGDCEVVGISERHTVYKANSGGIRFQMRTAGRSPQITLIAGHNPHRRLYKLTLGHETKVLNLNDSQEEKFPSRSLTDFHQFREFYVTWFNNKIRVGLTEESKPFVDYDRIYTEPNIGYIKFKTISSPDVRIPVEWIIETSPVLLKAVTPKTFHEELYWHSMIDGKLPPDAMIGGFENEFIYIARSRHNGSLCPGKYVPSTGMAYVPWGHMEHPKQEFEILCGYNGQWVKTQSNCIPQNAFIGGRSEVQGEPLYIGRAMCEGRLIPGKVHVRYNLCYLPYEGKEIEMSAYEILVIPQKDIPQANLTMIESLQCQK